MADFSPGFPYDPTYEPPNLSRQIYSHYASYIAGFLFKDPVKAQEMYDLLMLVYDKDSPGGGGGEAIIAVAEEGTIVSPTLTYLNFVGEEN